MATMMILRSFALADPSSLYPHRLQIYDRRRTASTIMRKRGDLAKRDPTKAAIFIGWWRDERNAFPLDHPFFTKYMPDGIQSSLAPLERKRVREVREAFGFEISLQQIAWYRWHPPSLRKSATSRLMDLRNTRGPIRMPSRPRAAQVLYI